MGKKDVLQIMEGNSIPTIHTVFKYHSQALSRIHALNHHTVTSKKKTHVKQMVNNICYMLCAFIKIGHLKYDVINLSIALMAFV